MGMTTAWAPHVARIHEVVRHWAERTPDALALEDATSRLTYSGLWQAVADVAASLRHLGVRAGDRVLFLAENSVAASVLVLATSALDAWTVLVNARLSPREIDDFIAHSGARIALYLSQVSPSALAHAQRHGAGSTDFPHIGPVHVGPLNGSAVPEDTHADVCGQVAAMIYTSGTSGKPKGVMLTHANILFAAEAVRDIRRIVPGDRLYGVMPMAHVVGLSSQLVGSLLSGATLVLKTRFDPEDLLRSLAGDGITVLTGVPAMFAKLLDFSRSSNIPVRAPTLRFMTVAGSPLSPSLKAATERAFGLTLDNGYGLTETAPTVAMTTAARRRTDCSVGTPLPGLEVRFVDAGGRDVAPGEIGELWVRGPNVMKGYYKSPELTAAALTADGWFNTGDLVRQDPDGGLHIEGRTKEMIIRSGFNVYPVEVEQVINAYPGVIQSAVVGRAVADNEEVVAFIEVAPDIVPDLAALQKYLRERLSPYKIPAEIVVLHQLPATPTGKLQKHVLKQLAAHRDAA
nr:AMP-binding protein [uncultured Noviherbaspirillum sp.]